MMKQLLALPLFASSLLAQPALGPVRLDDFSAGNRTNNASAPLWSAYLGEDPGQTFSIVNQMAHVVGDPSTGCGIQGCGIYFQLLEGTYDQASGFAKGWVQSGTFDTGNTNRLRFKFRCNKTIHGNADATGHSLGYVGTYTKNPSDTNPSNQGDHWYHTLSGDTFANHWTLVEINRHPQHQVGTPGDPGNNPSVGADGINYFDGLTRFYLDSTNAAVADGGADAWSGVACDFDDYYFDTATNSPDDRISNAMVNYDGAAYHVSFNSLPNVNETYNIRYSTSSMKTNGFSSGTDGGTLHTTQNDYTFVVWQSPNMAYSGSGMYFAIQPTTTSSLCAAGCFTEIFTPALDVTGLAIGTGSLPNGVRNLAYSQTLSAAGGTTPYAWDISAGSLCTGLGLSSAGVISGTPTTAQTCNFTARVTDSAGTPATATKALSIVIDPLSIASSSLTNGMVGVAYSQSLAATGGTSPYTWAITAGALPGGLSLSSGGLISGTPTTAITGAAFTVRATDATAASVTKALTITIATGGSYIGGSLCNSQSNRTVAQCTYTPSTGSLLVVGCWDNASTGTLTITDTLSNTWIQDKAVTGTAIQIVASSAIVASGGADTVSCTTSGATTNFGMAIAEYAGMATSSRVDVSSSAAGATANPSPGAVTTTNANDLLVSIFGLSNGSDGALTAGGGFTMRNGSGNGASIYVGGLEDRVVSATGAYTGSWTYALTGNWVGVQMAYKLATAGGAAPSISTSATGVKYSNVVLR